MQTILGRTTIPKDLGEAECKQLITGFILRAHRGNADQWMITPPDTFASFKDIGGPQKIVTRA